MRVIDTHFHWSPRSFFERLCEQSAFPRAERSDDSYVYWNSDGRRMSPPLKGQFDLERGIQISRDATGADTVLLITTGVLGGLLDQLPLDAAMSISREYNEGVAEAQERYQDDVFGTAYIPLNDTEEAIAQADYAIKELGLHGINLAPITHYGQIDHVRVDAFYAHVAELGVPLIIHPTDHVFADAFSDDIFDGAINLTIGRLLDSSVTVLRLIFSGVLARHPDLKVIHTHAGALLPYQAGRVDKNVQMSKSERICGLPKTPTEYLKSIYVDTVTPQPETIRYALEFYGSDHVIYGTDYSCWSPSEAIAAVDRVHLSPDEREAVLHKNAERLLGI